MHHTLATVTGTGSLSAPGSDKIPAKRNPSGGSLDGQSPSKKRAHEGLPLSDDDWKELKPKLRQGIEDAAQQSGYTTETLPDIRRAFNSQRPENSVLLVISLLSALSLTLINAHPSLRTIVEEIGVSRAEQATACGRMVAEFDAADYFGLGDLLGDAIKSGEWKEVCNIEFLRRRDSTGQGAQDVYINEQAKAVEDAWATPFAGGAASAVWDNIVVHFKPAIMNTMASDNVYANYFTIVQSSGMGKSRVVDELAKSHFVIPMNLRSGGSGFPPPDVELRDFLTTHFDDSGMVFARASACLEALFEESQQRVLDIKQDGQMQTETQIASAFRELMSQGQTAQKQGPFRVTFYEEVVNKANEKLEGGTARYMREHASPSRIKRDGKESKIFGPAAAFEELYETLTENVQPSVGSSKSTSKSKEERAPQVVIVFDEAHSLNMKHGKNASSPDATSTQAKSNTEEAEGTNFVELRRALRGLNSCHMFSLFLSTTGKMLQFSPSKAMDSSRRVTEGELKLIQPFTDLGFDHLAEKFRDDGSWDLDKVTSDEYMTHLGRPLLGSLYDKQNETVKNLLISFTASKLLNANQGELKKLRDNQAFAVLSQRLALEFKTTRFILPQEEEQVEGHMRVCLKIDADSQSMQSVSGSEPFLAEAAYFVMQDKGLHFHPPIALMPILQGYGIDQGDRGELIVLLLMTLARDRTIGPPGRDGRPQSGTRVMSVGSFLHNLFNVSRCDVLDTVRTHAASGSEIETLRAHISNAHFHFNHFHKVHQLDAMRRKNIMRLMVRGAGVICGNCQPGIDGVIAFCAEGKTISVQNTGLLMWQVKLDRRYTSTPRWDLFDLMDPAKLGFFDDERPQDMPGEPIPIIRIVFALAAKTPSVTVRLAAEDGTDKKPGAVPPAGPRFQTYDIWCAGLSGETLVPVMENEAAWQALPQVWYGWEAIYADENMSPLRKTLRQSQNPGAGTDDGFSSNWVDLDGQRV